MSQITTAARRKIKELQRAGMPLSTARYQVLSAAPDYTWRALNFGTYTPSDRTVELLRASLPPAADGLSAVIGQTGDSEPFTVHLGGDAPRHLVIEGPAGTGKTVALESLRDSIAVRYPDVQIIWQPGASADFLVELNLAMLEGGGAPILVALCELRHIARISPGALTELVDVATQNPRVHVVADTLAVSGVPELEDFAARLAPQRAVMHVRDSGTIEGFGVGRLGDSPDFRVAVPPLRTAADARLAPLPVGTQLFDLGGSPIG